MYKIPIKVKMQQGIEENKDLRVKKIYFMLGDHDMHTRKNFPNWGHMCDSNTGSKSYDQFMVAGANLESLGLRKI